jgi:hypothetical protein
MLVSTSFLCGIDIMVVMIAKSLLYVLPLYTAVDFWLPAQPFSQPEAKPSAFCFKLGIDIMVGMIAKSLLYHENHNIENVKIIYIEDKQKSVVIFKSLRNRF